MAMTSKDFKNVGDGAKQGQLDCFTRFVEEENMDPDLVADIVGTCLNGVYQSLQSQYKNFDAKKWKDYVFNGSEYDKYLSERFGIQIKNGKVVKT